VTKNVYVGMSGGVDSSLSAALLVEAGYSVTGVYMKNWTRDLPGFICPWKEDFKDAKQVAVSLGIPLISFDFENEYRQKVVDYMVESYLQGLTPNPDIVCNQEIKFKLFLNTALEHGADMIATGHYARTKDGKLYKGLDSSKDQTYFLYRVSEEALDKTIFPLGEMTKKRVREEAAKRNLVTATKPDSQGICFVGEVGIKQFLLSELGPQPHGSIVNQKGEEIGEHDGAIYYTIGQRHGLSVGGGLPYYVTHKDMSKNIVYVTTELTDKRLWSNQIHTNNLWWINNKPEANKTYQVKCRYRSEDIKCKINLSQDNTAVIELQDEVRAISAGQSAVIYDGDLVIGGGIIYS